VHPFTSQIPQQFLKAIYNKLTIKYKDARCPTSFMIISHHFALAITTSPAMHYMQWKSLLGVDSCKLKLPYSRSKEAIRRI